ncbi:MAG: serine/threonine-protein kinase [Acidobacteriota bacterium]
MNIDRLKKHFTGKYEFIKLLGKGGFAEVYLALDKMLEREVAIKVLLPQHASDPEIVKRFIREARLYAKLEHPNLISIYETGIAEGTAFIVMKYVKGDNLKSYIQKNIKTRLELAPGLIRSLSAALSYIHDKGIIHRDVKPANIILEDGGKNIFLADFGIARSDSSQTMTQTGSIMGTPYYISPEQVKGGNVDQRSDIYAFGATLFELVTGKPVFSADSSVEILYKHVNSEPEPVGNSAPGTPKNIRYIISKCLEKRPEKRFQTATEMNEILAGRQSASITRYLNSLEAGKKNGKKKLMLVISLIILIPVITFLAYNKFYGVKKSDPVKIEKQMKAEGMGTDHKPEMKLENKIGEKSDIPEAGKEKLISTTPEIRKEKISDPVFRKKEIRKSTDEKKPEKGALKTKVQDKPGIIRFSSYPPSDIYWNGLKLGNTTQIFNKDFPPGKYKFIFKIEGYLSEEREVSVKSGQEVPAHYRFSPFGFLTITARPYARFYINNIDNGEDPVFEKKFPVGSYKIRAVKKGYITEEKIIKINNMKKTYISFSLKKEE